MKYCIFCDKYKDDKEFNTEHVLLESLGGKLKVNDFVCTECNTKFSNSEFDTKLHEALKVFAISLQPNFDRKNKSSIRTNNSTCFYFDKNNKLKLKKGIIYDFRNESDSLSTIKIKHSTIKQRNDIINRINKIAKDENANINFNELIDNDKKMLQEKITSCFKMYNDVFPSISKSAIEYYYLLTKDIITTMSLAKKFNSNNYSNCKFCYNGELRFNFDFPESISHFISLQFSKITNQVFIYISYFGVANFIFLISNYYDGDNINYSYYHDLINNYHISFKNKIDLSKIDFKNIPFYPSMFCKNQLQKLCDNFCYKLNHKSTIRLLYNECKRFNKLVVMNLSNKEYSNALNKHIENIKNIPGVIVNIINNVMYVKYDESYIEHNDSGYTLKLNIN